MGTYLAPTIAAFVKKVNQMVEDAERNGMCPARYQVFISFKKQKLFHFLSHQLLLVFTDGAIEDMAETVMAVVAVHIYLSLFNKINRLWGLRLNFQGSYLPLSIVIINVSNNVEGGNILDQIDSDDRLLIAKYKASSMYLFFYK